MSDTSDIEFQIYKTGEGSEAWDANGKVTQLEIKYFVLEAARSKKQAMQQVLDDAPVLLDGMKKDGVRFDGFDEEGNAEITVSYKEGGDANAGLSSGGAVNSTSVTFDCGTGSQHIEVAINQKRLWTTPGALVPNAGNFIGWNGKTGADMQITGVDVPFAQPRETHVKKMTFAQLSTSFRRRVAKLVGCVNNAKWKGWEKGEVMFLGCSFSGTSGETVDVSFNFAIQMNETLTIASGVPAIKKEGHWYVWTIKDTERAGAGTISTSVKAVFGSQIAKYADFSELGL